MSATTPTVLTGPTKRSANRRGAELLLLVFAAVITMTALVIVDVNQHQPLSVDLLRYLGAYLALFIMAHIAVRRFARYADPLLLPVVALLNGLGVVMIYRLGLSDTGESASGAAADQQLLWTLLAVMAFIAVVWLLADYRILARYGYVCGVAGVLALAIPALLPASVSEQNGAKIWIRLPGFSVEPAEFAKILLLIFFAAVLVAKRHLFASAGTHVLGMTLPRPRDLAPLLAACVIALAVLVSETDLGASLLLYVSFLVMVYIATARLGWVVIGLIGFGLGSVAAYHIFGHVRVRVHNWQDPFADANGVGYQMVQSLFSFATGGVFGTGLGNGQPGTVPLASSDFIVAAFGEELGLVGLSALLMLYAIVIVRGLRTAIAVRDSFGKLLAGGLAATLGIQLFLVVGGVTNFIPQTGLTTPWLSYGGSSLLANYVLLAILVRVSHAARRPIGEPVRTAPIAAAHTEAMKRAR
jgi:cell division protein FtsW